MLRNKLWPIGVVALAACSTITDEQRGTIVVDGKTYELRTRQMETSSRSYEVSDVQVKNRWVTCRPAVAGDCEIEVRSARNRDSNRGN